MIAAILAATLALAGSADTGNATLTTAAMQPVKVVQFRLQSGLDVHIRPIDPAGDFQAKMLELSG